MPVVFVPFIPQRRPAWDTHGSLRSRVRGQLRKVFEAKIEELRPGTWPAHMSYTEDGFANRIVAEYGLKLVGWPDDIPFTNLSEIPGGTRTLLRLRALWQAGTLHFEAATIDDVANAARDPRSVNPNPRSDSESSALAVTPLARRPPTVVSPAVLHPSSLAPMGEHPTSTQPSVRTLGVRPRQQRRDTKQSRRRPVTNPENKPLRRPKPGVKSARYVVETANGGYHLTNDPIEEFRSPALSRMRRATLGGGKVVGDAPF